MPKPKPRLTIPTTDPPDLVAGRAALGRGAWSEAMVAFSRLLEAEQAPAIAAEASAGIGLASYWTGESERSVAALERALSLYGDLRQPAAAARIACTLADVQLTYFGAAAVANGLIQQAEHLLEGEPIEPTHAWVHVYRGHYDLMVDKNPTAALARARDALRIAHKVDAPEPAVVALALEGLALVTTGDVGEGMPRLDEASAAAVTRGLDDLNAVAWACCYLIHGCESVRDFPRAADWCQRVMSFCDQFGLEPIFGSCRTRYALVLTWQGRWDAADAELRALLDATAQGQPTPLRRIGLVALGELRRRQGAHDEAERAFHLAGEHQLGLLGQASLALDRGEPDLAIDLSDRVLRRLPAQERAGRTDALLIHCRAAAAIGDTARARAAAHELAETASRIRTAPLLAAAAFASGFVAAAEGDDDAARTAFEDAVSQYDSGGAPLEAALARLELADALDRLGRHRTAEREARLAKDALASLGARAYLSRAVDMLERFVQPAAERKDASSTLALSERELEVLALVARGLTNEEIADRLILSPHTIKRHIANVLMKLGESTRAAAVARATRAGLL